MNEMTASDRQQGLQGRDLNFEVGGMTCASCAGRVEKALKKLDGIEEVDVNLAMNSAHIRLAEDTPAHANDVAAAVRKAGYDVAEEKLAFDIDGMTCASCSGRVEKALLKLPGVVSATVNLAMERADLVVLPGTVSDRQVVQAVEKAGYHAVSRNTKQSRDDAENNRRKDYTIWWLVASIVLTTPLVAQMIWMSFGVDLHIPAWVELALATPVQFVIGSRFYRGAWSALRNRAANMDVLVSLGTTAAYFLSLYNMFQPGSNGEGHLYFEASAVIITLILGGKIMEERAKRGASAAIRELMALRPRKARRLNTETGEETEVSVDDLLINDIVRVRPGEKLPIDGVVTSGESEIDESLITGETRPVLRKAGDDVVGGAVNGTGRLEIRVNAVGEDTTLSRIIRLVEQAQTGKAPVQQMVDKVAAIFVPIIIVVALVTLGGWLVAGYGLEAAIVAAVSVLVIACPCALGLATPTALVAGTGAAARSGILIRNFEALEQAHNVDAVIFDKTGTLTEGVLTVTDIAVALSDQDEKELLRLVASVQAASEHPLAQAVVRAAGDRGLKLAHVDDFKSTTGAGVSGTVDGHTILIGTEDLLLGQNIALPDAEVTDKIRQVEQTGCTVVLVAMDGRFAGYLALEDKIRESAIAAVADLKARGVDSIMLSGDAEDVAMHVAKLIGMKSWRGRIRPQDKAREVEKLRKEGRHVAMVGDGINDAPALAAADVGIAMGGGTDVAMETAGITLMRSDPALVAGAIDISIATRRKITQNLFWAFGYNVIGVPLAAFGILSPAIAGAAMALSSVSVVTNSLTLRSWKIRKKGAEK
ncbi:heavy metal translocating P-type ATPase [Thalassospira marina]|nr:heavy metal translocating P-type ATPase [Thalassospira marina]